MKKMILICFLALCGGIIYGSDDLGSEVDFQTDTEIQKDLEKYISFFGKITKIPGVVPKKNAEEVCQYADTLKQYQENDLICIDYQNAVRGQFAFLTNLNKRVYFLNGNLVTIMVVPVIQENNLTGENQENVKCYVNIYREFLGTLRISDENEKSIPTVREEATDS